MGALDKLYRSVLMAVRFFSRGWGPTHVYERLAQFNPTLVNPEQCAAALQDHTHQISLTQVKRASWGSRFAGHFLSPTATLFPDILPPEAHTARFELVLPGRWNTAHRPVCIHLAGTGDHGFSRRRHMMALPLLKKENMAALILENPFYGSRKPPRQTASQLLHVSDLLAMGLSLMLECLVLKQWLEGEGLGPVGLTGLSMGGHNASLCSSVWPEAVPVVPCLSWSTASSAFTQGMLSGAVSWSVLEDQLAHVRSSSDKIRQNIFDFALAHQSAMKSSGRLMPPTFHTTVAPYSVNSSSVVERVWLSSGGSSIGREQPCAETTPPDVPCPTATPLECHYSWLRNSKRARESSQLHWDTVNTLRAILDLSTHLHNYPIPRSTSLAKFVVAKDDLYIPRQQIASVQDTWPGCEVSIVEGGHVSATLLHCSTFQDAIAEKMRDKITSIP